MKKKKLEEAKQYFDILCDEINIKQCFFAVSEKGSIGYDRTTRKFIIKKC